MTGRAASIATVIAGALACASALGAQQPAHPDSARAGATDSLAGPPRVVRHLSRDLRVCAGGDVTLGTNLDTAWARVARLELRKRYRTSDAPSALLAPLKPLVRDADVVLLNVESAIGAGRAPQKCPKDAQNCFAFRSPPSAAHAIRALAPRAAVVGNIANNHARDAGPRGLERTVELLTRRGVAVTGVDTLATPVATRHGDTIAVLGFYTSNETPDARDTAAVRRHVARAVAQWGTVIVTMHLGAEGASAQRTVDSTEMFLGTIDRGNPVAFANAALDAGATMVVGHGPHVLRAGEWRDGRLVLYSLGNLLTYGPFGLREPMNRGAVACATIDTTGRVAAAELRSTFQRAPGVLRADGSARAAMLIDSLSALDFPTTGLRVRPNGVVVVPKSEPVVGAPSQAARPASPPKQRTQR